MPGRNHKGPNNEGPMTGRKLGDCRSQNDTNEYAEFGRGLGMRNGQGRHNGRGVNRKPMGRNRNR